MDRTFLQVLKLIEPSEEERAFVEKNRDYVIKRINRTFNDNQHYRQTIVIGSAATGNFLKGRRDLDGIVLFTEFDKNTFRRGITNIKGLENLDFNEKTFAVLDKVSAKFGEFKLSLGAFYNNISPESHLAADMVHHPEFVKTHLKDNQRNDVLLTKGLLKLLNIYGAKIGGFATEQLIIRYGSFENLLQVLSSKENIFLDFSGKYTGEISSIVVTYPFSGLGNLTWRISEEDRIKIRDYANKVRENPSIFLDEINRSTDRKNERG